MAELEKRFLQRDPPADGWLTLSDLVSMTGRSDTWVQSTIRKERLPSGEKRVKNGSSCLCFPPEVATRLNTLANKIPKAGKWMTASAIARHLQKGEKWVQSRIAENFANRGEVRIGSQGTANTHYPPSVIRGLEQMSGAARERGEWMTVNQIAKFIGRDSSWVKRRLENDHSAEGELRVDRTGKKVLHFSPDIVRALKEQAVIHPQAGSWLSINDLAKKLQRDRSWVERRIRDNFSSIGEMRLSRSGRSCIHFPPRIVRKLRNME